MQKLLLMLAFAGAITAQNRIPRAWDDAAIASATLPLAVADATPVQIPSKYYYGIPVRPIYKSYPVYHPTKEPPGYIDHLKQLEPILAFDVSTLKTHNDWTRAGEIVFDSALSYGSIAGPRSNLYLRDPAWHQYVGTPVAKDGTIPFYRYVITKKGTIEIGVFSCAMCHTRVMPDGSILKGAQGNFPFNRALARDAATQSFPLSVARPFLAPRIERTFYGAPWLGPDSYPANLSWQEIVARHAAIPPGVIARHGTTPLVPAKVPDLIGIQERRYLDATGLARHRDIGDLMRYATMNQDTDLFARYRDFVPSEAVPIIFGKAPEDPSKLASGRFSDEQLYALALYLYSLNAGASVIVCWYPNYNSSSWYGLRLKSKAPLLPSIRSTNDEESQLSKPAMLAVQEKPLQEASSATVSTGLRGESVVDTGAGFAGRPSARTPAPPIIDSNTGAQSLMRSRLSASKA